VTRVASWSFEAIGTVWQIDSEVELDDVVRRGVTRRIDEFDAAWSRFRDDSLVARLRTGEPVVMPDDAAPLLATYDRLVALTSGAVNPLVGGSLERLGYDAAYTLRPTGAPLAAPPWRTARWEAPRLTVPAGVTLDVGAAGTGCLVDLIAGVLADHGIDDATVDGSGDLFHLRPAPLRVALEHPLDPRFAVGVAALPTGHALCGSAVNRRAWGDGLHHLLDARTGQPVRDVLATWVLAPRTLLADALSTALFFVPPAAVVDAFPGTAAVRMTAAQRLEAAGDFPGELFA
jgi:thiamine biosynthesis lipoprotein